MSETAQTTGPFIVTEKAMRPASPERRCFYCHVEIGGEHKPNCLLIQKRAKVRMTVEYEVEIPARWGAHQVEFHRNEGSWCANNAIGELERAFRGDDKHCMCGVAEFKYIGPTSEPYLDEK